MTKVALLCSESNPILTLHNLNCVGLRSVDIDNLVATLIVHREDVILIDGTQFRGIYLVALVYFARSEEHRRGDKCD